MEQKVNKIYAPLFTEKPRYVILMGGRGAGRSTVASQFANSKLVAPEYFRCAIMRYVLGDIRNSIYREILDRAEENGVLNNLEVNETTMSIKYGANSINAVGFRKSSSDQKSKLKSLANYNCVIIEEADETPEQDFMQLDDSLRTVKGDIVIVLLLNCPPKDHWIIQRWFDLKEVEGVKDFYLPQLKEGMDDTVFIRSSFRDNEKNMSADSIRNYENYEKTKPDYYHNMIAGYVPETVRGRIYSGWETIDEIPFGARLVRRALDFGYTNDPTAIVDIYEYDGGLILDEQLYKTGYKNRQIASFILALPEPDTLVIGDSSEPKSIDEISEAGVTILGAKKQKQEEDGGKKSYLNWSIGIMQDKKIRVTRRSKNLIKEKDNYSWKEDRDGNSLNVPIDAWNHALDAARYGIVSLHSEIPVSYEYDINKYENNENLHDDIGV